MIELGPFNEASKLLEVGFGFARVSDDERGSKDEIGNRAAQALDHLVHALATVSAPHGAKHRIRRVLKRHVDVRENLLVLRDDFDERVAERFRVEVVRANPANAIDLR